MSGELLRIIAQEGETVPMGAPIARSGDAGWAAGSVGATRYADAGPLRRRSGQRGCAVAGYPAGRRAVPVAYLIDAQPRWSHRRLRAGSG